jgi:hypothetical protein
VAKSPRPKRGGDEEDVTPALMDSLGAASDSLGQFAGIAGAAAGAATAFLSALTKLPEAVGRFVAAFSPAVMERFQQTVGDLTAVIGAALEPVVTAFTTLTREISNYLLPVVERLRPVVQRVMEGFLGSLMPAVAAVARVFEALIPALDALADPAATEALHQMLAGMVEMLVPFVKALAALFAQLAPVIMLVINPLAMLAPIFQALLTVVVAFVQTVVQAVASFVSSLFGGDTRGVMQTFRDAIQKVASAMVILAAYIAELVGASSFTKNLIANLGGDPAAKKDTTGFKAAQSPVAQSFADYGKSVSLAASVAGGQASEMKQEDFWRETIAHLKGIEGNREKVIKIITDAIEKAWKAIVSAILGEPPDPKAEAHKINNVLGTALSLNPSTAILGGVMKLFGDELFGAP